MSYRSRSRIFYLKVRFYDDDLEVPGGQKSGPPKAAFVLHGIAARSQKRLTQYKHGGLI